MVVPAPLVAAPVEATDNSGTTGVAILRTPEEDDLSLQGVRDEVRVREPGIQNARVQDGLAFEELFELRALHDARLLGVGEVEADLRDIHLAALLVRFDRPSLGDERVGIAVGDQGAERFDLGLGLELQLGKELPVERLEGALRTVLAPNFRCELDREVGIARELDQRLETFREDPIK